MSLVDRMTTVYDKVYSISDRLGVPTHVDFSYRVRGSDLSVEVLPRPRLGNPPAHMLTMWEKSGNVEVNSGDKYVTGVSRTFETITEGTICKIDGKSYSILWIDKEQIVTYNLLVRPERAR